MSSQSLIRYFQAVSGLASEYKPDEEVVSVKHIAEKLEEVQSGEMRVIAEGSPKTDCPLCGSSDLDCEDDAPAFHVHCNGCGTHFDNQDSFAFFDRRPPAREMVALTKSEGFLMGQAYPCRCHKCTEALEKDAPEKLFGRMMILCSRCGNKRCPHATDHELACSGSNDPGQKGSVYE